MNVLILNGSPRLKGNTSYALRTIAKGIKANTTHEVELIDVAYLKLAGCTACCACKKNGGNCVICDDGVALINKVYAADAVVFGTPVYWWGISAQLKSVLDRFYAKSSAFKNMEKQIGIVAVGTSALTNKQYELIRGQFGCICDYLGWDIKFSLSFSASEPDDLRASENAVSELSQAWKLLG